MKWNLINRGSSDNGELIAMFGNARLIRRLDRRHELVGGTAEDLVAAKEWVSLFAHDIVFHPSARNSARDARVRSRLDSFRSYLHAFEPQLPAGCEQNQKI